MAASMERRIRASEDLRDPRLARSGRSRGRLTTGVHHIAELGSVVLSSLSRRSIDLFQVRDSFSIHIHSLSETGMTERRDIRTSGKSRKDLSALISARVTGRESFLTGAMSTATSLPDLSFGSE